ncbi:F-box only protein 7 isoform X2 [Anolis carolinensis]|uniref:F-box only protein 7 isoform X2 n=1 Tax=Anolis carolinensis TaxID=28377 RepID=UPI0004624B36|nr:PREDICTED: F-box only protein 7 isoform X2 [Anolis carolinensis]|eukprot:XP_008108813.1 PREDICTED: F-box only protein 7 isoform X2 [Anolis carolinensis]
MKLRVRARKRTAPLELPEAEPTLGDLRAHLGQALLPSWGYSSETKFEITLNNKDSLVGDQDTLASFGIVSGDLICLILEDDAALRLSSPSSSSLPSSQSNHGSSISAVSHSHPRNEDNKLHNGHIEDHKIQCDNQMSDNMAGPSQEFTSEGGPDDLDLQEATGSFPSEPMLCCEATDGQVPHSLQTLYHSAECTNANDALIVSIHLIMMETGYVPQGTEAKASSMPENWRNKGVYKLLYTHPLCENGFAVLTCVPLGNLIVVNAMLKITSDIKSVKRLQLLPTSFICFQDSANVVGVYKDLQKLSRLFKDRLVYPLLAAARQDPVARSRDTDWKELYKKKMKQKRDALRWRHMMFLPPPPLPIPLHPNPLYPNPFPPNPLYPPMIIGGEMDERPTPPYIGDPIHSLFPASTEFLPGEYPLGSHLDPFGSFQNPNPTLPGRTSRGRPIDSRRAFI